MLTGPNGAAPRSLCWGPKNAEASNAPMIQTAVWMPACSRALSLA
jgi:hypothetical protein